MTNIVRLFALAIIPLIIGNDMTKNWAEIVLLLFVVVGFRTFYRDKDVFYLLTPISLVFFYISISLMIGAWGYRNEFVVIDANLDEYYRWNYMHYGLSLTMFCLAVLASVEYKSQWNYSYIRKRLYIRPSINMVISCVLLAPFFFFPLDLDVLGGDGDLSIVPKTVAALIVILYAQNFERSLSRWLVYLCVILFFGTFSIHDKREAIFLVLPALYLEMLREPKELSLKLSAGLVGLGALLLILILSMSVARGYGDFGAFDSIFETLPLIFEYIKSEAFIGSLLANIEATYFFFHGLNSIELIFDDLDHLGFGVTILKPLLVFLPRSIAPWKPDSIIGLYTSAYDPAIRELRGSWPISIISEFVWNFHILALLASYMLAAILVRFQIALLTLYGGRYFTWIIYLFAYMNLVMLARGSGLDQYVVYLLIAIFFAAACRVFSDIVGWERRPSSRG